MTNTSNLLIKYIHILITAINYTQIYFFNFLHATGREGGREKEGYRWIERERERKDLCMVH